MAGDQGDSDDDDLFLQAMRGVERIDQSNLRQRESGKKHAGRRGGGTSPRARTAFVVETTPEFAEGRAPGVSDRVVAELRAGKRPVDRKVDLHGLRRDVAIDTVRGRVDSAARDGHRCLLFVHGRGKHSGGAPVLRDATLEALTTAPTSRLVRAFCTARREHGGAGALYVLLARPAKQAGK